MSGSYDDGESQGDVATIQKPKLKRPRLYKVLLHNDDYSTMDFVVLVLQKYFNKPFDEAQRIMLDVHKEGIGVCGVYTFEIAEAKTAQVIQFARDNGQPLMCSFEPE